jgi:hypothetical protein
MAAAKFKRSNYFVLALALSFLLPGAGHLALGARLRGYIFIGLVFVLLLILAVAIFVFAESGAIALVMYVYGALIVVSLADVIYILFSQKSTHA